MPFLTALHAMAQRLMQPPEGCSYLGHMGIAMPGNGSRVDINFTRAQADELLAQRVYAATTAVGDFLASQPGVLDATLVHMLVCRDTSVQLFDAKKFVKFPTQKKWDGKLEFYEEIIQDVPPTALRALLYILSGLLGSGPAVAVVRRKLGHGAIVYGTLGFGAVEPGGKEDVEYGYDKWV